MSTLPVDFSLSLIKKEKVSQDAYAFYFDRTKNPDFEFRPGQYIRMTIPHENPDERGSNRLFSLITSPLDKEKIGITTRIIQSSFKKALASLSEGSQVQFSGPRGMFIFDETDIRPRVFLAGGIGITPFHSMLLYINEKKLSIPITFFASFSTVADIVFYDELMNFQKENPNIKIVYTVSRPEESGEPWSGETGRISQELIKKYVGDISKALYMVAGPSAMVQAMFEIVQTMGGVPQDQIKKETFTGY